jgi:hypothetical protein
MLCNYLNDIYLNHIHPNLTGDEYIYSAEAKETFLDLWFSCNNIKTHPNFPNSEFYCKNNKILFRVRTEFDKGIKYSFLICDYVEVWNGLGYTGKNSTSYNTTQKIINNVANNILKLDIESSYFIEVDEILDFNKAFRKVKNPIYSTTPITSFKDCILTISSITVD